MSCTAIDPVPTADATRLMEPWRTSPAANTPGVLVVDARDQLVAEQGRVAMATYGAYAGAKFALEAVSDALRREVAGFGVTVIVVEPGAVITEMSGRGVATADRLAAGMTSDQHERYDALIGAITTQSQSFTRAGVPAAHAARVIADAITSTKPRTRYTVGRDAAILVRLARLAPRPVPRLGSCAAI